MERTTNKLIVLLLFLVTAEVSASYRTEVYRAYISGDMKSWKSAIDRMQAEKPAAPEKISELVNYQYGYIGWCIGNKMNEEARKYLQLAEKNLDLLAKYESFQSLVSSYKAAFYGYRIGMNGLLAPVLGLRSIESADQAVLLDKENYFAYVQKGNIEFYMPSVFGGSKKEALNHFMKARDLLEKSPENISENWNYLSVLILIAQTYSYLDDFVSSKKYLDKILELEPGFVWVKDEMYPKIVVQIK
jgi:tetratricopeptide (TPR) repeat protein